MLTGVDQKKGTLMYSRCTLYAEKMFPLKCMRFEKLVFGFDKSNIKYFVKHLINLNNNCYKLNFYGVLYKIAIIKIVWLFRNTLLL